jgi:hypothetical protein
MGPISAQFRLQLSISDGEGACHRALRSPDWEERASDLLEVESTPDGMAGVALLYLLLERAGYRDHPMLRAQAPVGPAGADAQIIGVWTHRVIVRISLQGSGSAATDMTISGSGLPGLSDAMVRSAIGDIRRSIEIQSGSLTPYRPGTS